MNRVICAYEMHAIKNKHTDAAVAIVCTKGLHIDLVVPGGVDNDNDWCFSHS